MLQNIFFYSEWMLFFYVILYSSKYKILRSTTVFNIHNEKNWLLKIHFAITEINYILKYIKIKYFNV